VRHASSPGRRRPSPHRQKIPHSGQTFLKFGTEGAGCTKGKGRNGQGRIRFTGDHSFLQSCRLATYSGPPGKKSRGGKQSNNVLMKSPFGKLTSKGDCGRAAGRPGAAFSRQRDALPTSCIINFIFHIKNTIGHIRKTPWSCAPEIAFRRHGRSPKLGLWLPEKRRRTPAIRGGPSTIIRFGLLKIRMAWGNGPMVAPQSKGGANPPASAMGTAGAEQASARAGKGKGKLRNLSQ